MLGSDRDVLLPAVLMRNIHVYRHMKRVRRFIN